MKVVVLAGGYGTRLSEETAVVPKPMVEIGGHPILWHIMRIYLAHGLDEFIICCGYKSSVIKDFFASYTLRRADVTFDMRTGTTELHRQGVEPWRVTLVDTGDHTMTAGRLKRVRDYVGDETFCMTYGDGVSNVDVNELLAFHRSQQALATLTAVQPPGRFGAFTLEPDQALVEHFHEKPRGDHDGAWVNGGFFALEPQVFDFIDGDETVWEAGPLERLAREGRLAAYRHEGFWQPMDTLRDKMVLEQLWESGSPPWKLW